ncbi:reverse transcriptase domain-containing protein [Tanacetum coccineum]
MVDSQPIKEEFQGVATRDTGMKTHGGPIEPVLQTQKTPSPSPAFIKENIDVFRTMIKEHDQQAKMEAPTVSLAKGFSDRFSLESSGTSDTHRQTRSTIKSQKASSKNKEPAYLRRSIRFEDQNTNKEKARRERSKPKKKRSEHQESSSDSEYEEGLDDAFEDLNSPYRRPKPTPFTQRITRFKYHKRAKLPRNIRVYEGNKDREDHLGIFSAASEQEEWSMPIWCKMFRQTLGGAAQNWFDDLDPKSVDSFEDLSRKFLEEFSQQKRYAKDPTEIHGIKRQQNKGLQAFMDRFKSESSHIKGVPLVLRISDFMHGHSHPELAKKLNDKISKTVDEMFKRVGAFIRGEVGAGSAEMGRPSQ